MNFDQIKALGTSAAHFLPTGGGILGGLLCLYLLFKVKGLVTKLALLCVAAGLFAAAVWWLK